MSVARVLGIVLVVGLSALLLSASTTVRAQKPEPKEPPFKVSKEEQAILDLTNKEREKEKLPLLKPNEKLFKAARGHSENMAKQDKMEHVLDEKDPLQRVKAAGYAYSWVGENIAFGQKTPTDLLEGWMKSEPHKANILGDKFTEIGIGIAFNEKGKPYYTQVFAAPKSR